MKKLDLFKKVLTGDTYRDRDWIISAFSITQEVPDVNKHKLDPWHIYYTPTGSFFMNPEKGGELEKIDDAVKGEPVFKWKEKAHFEAKTVANLSSPIETTYGTIFVNALCLAFPFGDKIPFMTGRFDASDMEKRVLPLMIDETNKNHITIDEYKMYCNALSHLDQFMMISVQPASYKTILPAEGIHQLRDKLFEENKGHLDDPEVLAKINTELSKYDKNWMKGDPAEHSLSGNAFDIVRMRLFNTMGGDAGLSDDGKVDHIPKALVEGDDLSKFTAMSNSSRNASYNRGVATMLGGELVKWLLRISANVNIVQGDCGSVLGIHLDIDKSNYNKLVGMTVIEKDGKQVKITSEEAASKYIDKSVRRRSPMYCRKLNTDYCSVCAGDRLALHPEGASVAISGEGNRFMMINMKAMHGKALTLARYNYLKAIR